MWNLFHVNSYSQKFQDHPMYDRKTGSRGGRRHGFDLDSIPPNTPPAVIRMRDLGPPTRKEETSLYEDVKTAAAHPGLDWPAKDVEAVTSDDRRGSPWHYRDNLLPVLYHLQEAHGQSWPGAVHIPWEKWQGRQREGLAPPTGDGAIGVAKGVYRGSNVLALGDFGQYQHLGFNFWSFERMRLAGFLSHPSNHCDYAASKYHCAWLSVLAPDDVAKVVEKRQATVE
ncbi:hypothetical protein PG987_001114 [Apiospora arundinis]